jgi:N-acetylglutamate synthase-like GNAT family acetyltransferase
MEEAAFTVRPVEPRDRQWIVDLVRQWGGTDYVVSRGRVIHPAELPGFCAVGPDGGLLGIATYEIAGSDCQLVTLHALRRFVGIGTALLATVRETAGAHGCARLWLITTNDNLDALRFYQRRDFELVAVHRDLREVARQLKPSIPLIGDFGIPLRDEIELEVMLD